MDRDRRAVAGVQHAVDVGGAEGEDAAGIHARRRRRAAEHESLLAHGARHDGNCPRREIVVVKAGVLVVGPGDDPGVDVLVVDELDVDAVAGVGRDQVAPLVGAGREVGDEVAQLGLGERGGHAATPTWAWSTRAGLSIRRASAKAGQGATTGRSDP